MSKVVNLNDLILDDDLFYKKLNSYKQQALDNYNKRYNTLTFLFNNQTYECSIANFITQMIFLIPFVDLKLKPTDDFIILSEIQNFNKSTLTNYINKIIKFCDENITDGTDYIEELSVSIKKIISISSDLSGKCNVYSGTTINLHDLISLYTNNKEFKEIVDRKIPDNMEFNDIGEFINNKFKEAMKILKNEENCYKHYFLSGTGLNEKQFKEIISSIGLKAGLDGIIIPHVIQTNFFKGFDNITDFFINSILARKALITSHKRVKDSGYLNRKLSLLLIDTLLSDEEDCGSDEYIDVNLSNKEIANRYNLRYFLNDDGDLERFDSEEHKNLIGKTLHFRSPIKCKCHDGKVCKTCYGDLSIVNKVIHIGIEAVLELMEQITQTLLSAKHLQQVITDKINWDEKFKNLFVIDKNEIYPDTEKEKAGWMIIFDDDDDFESEEGTDNISVKKFILRNKVGTEFPIELPFELILCNSLKESVQNSPIRDSNNRITVSFKSLCYSEEPVFTFSLENNELSTSLQALIDLIETSDHLGIKDIDEMNNKFMELLGEGKIHLSAVHAELIERQLVRKKSNLVERPERFDEQDNPDSDNYYTILKVSDGIFNSPSSSTSLSFEQIKKQLQQSPEIFFRNGTSILDELFFQ